MSNHPNKKEIYSKNKAYSGKTHSDEFKAKMSECRMAEGNPFYGKEHTEETKEKISNIHKGNFNSSKRYLVVTNENIEFSWMAGLKKLSKDFDLNYSYIYTQVNKGKINYLSNILDFKRPCDISCKMNKFNNTNVKNSQGWEIKLLEGGNFKNNRYGSRI